MQIRHEVENADENAKTNGHREVNDSEADTEHYAHTKSNDSLPTNIVIEFALHILGQLLPEWTILLGENFDPTISEIFVIQKNKKHI